MMENDGRTVGLAELVRGLWDHKFLIATLCVGLGALAFGGSYLVKVRYEATVTVTSAEDDGLAGQIPGGAQGLLSQLGGAAALIGLSTPGADQNNEAIAVLQSRKLTESFIKDADLIPVLYADKWDPKSLQWKGGNAKRPPTLWFAANKFGKEVRFVSTDRKTGMIQIGITWTDPVVAARWANELVRATNSAIRERVLAEASRNIAFLNDELGKTAVVSAREMLSSLLEREVKRSMLARGRDDYALRVIDPAVAPEKKSSPRRSLWLLAGLLLGFGLGASVACIRSIMGRGP